MKAAIQDRYGTAGVVTAGDLPKPVPAGNEVLVRIRAVSLNGSDRENLAGRPFYTRLGGLRRPPDPLPAGSGDRPPRRGRSLDSPPLRCTPRTRW